MRRSEFELGITDLSVEDLHVGSRILYYAPSCDRFAEHELDYIVFAKKDVNFSPNSDEIASVAWVSISDFDDFLASHHQPGKETVTPWFQILRERKLMPWWRSLINTGAFPDEGHRIETFTNIQ